MDGSAFPLNNCSRQIVSAEVKREVVWSTRIERGENITIIACINAAGTFASPIIIFTGSEKFHTLKIDCLRKKLLQRVIPNE